jgi:hypothetical protein
MSVCKGTSTRAEDDEKRASFTLEKGVAKLTFIFCEEEVVALEVDAPTHLPRPAGTDAWERRERENQQSLLPSG